MKLALIVSSVLSVASAMSLKGHSVAKVLATARRLDGQQNQQQDQQDMGEYAFLTQYALKLVGCKAQEVVVNPENGEYEYNAAIVRLCPADSCDDDGGGCDSGYGDLVVGLNTFVEAFFEDQRDNMNWGDDFNPDEYTECREYEVEQEDGDDQQNQNQNQQQGQQMQYYIGPTCADDGVNVKVGLFTDELCTYVAEETFEDISNGWSLPFEDGGMVSTECSSCLVYNDNYEQELRELCEQSYMNAGAKCEEKMEYYSYYGQNVQGCEYVGELLPQKSVGGNGGAVFGWIVFFLVIAGAVGYVLWWRSKKAASTNDGLMN